MSTTPQAPTGGTALPNGFSEWEHLQSTLMKVHNREVKEEFKDIADGTDVTTIPRASLKHACLLKDNDTAEMTQLRMMLFWFNLRRAKDLQGNFYGMPLQDVQASRKYRPQIKLFFLEHLTGVDEEEDYPAVTGEITFRLMTKTSQTLTKSDLTTYANEIKSTFATPAYKWNKGKDMATYTDKEKGYQLQLLVKNKTDAKELITKILGIQDHTPNWKYLNYKANEEPTEAFPTIPQKEAILGKQHKLPRTRPVATVVFQYATCHVHGLPNPICLIDRSGKYLDVVVS